MQRGLDLCCLSSLYKVHNQGTQEAAARQRAIKVKILCRFDWSYFVLIISQPTTQATSAEPNPSPPPPDNTGVTAIGKLEQLFMAFDMEMRAQRLRGI